MMRGAPITPGRPYWQFDDAAMPFEPRIQGDRFYGLLPTRSSDQARLDDAIDRKYWPLCDLEEAEGWLLASERLVVALTAAGASGFRATPVPHATEVPVSGHVAFRLEAEGFTGPVVDTAFMPMKVDPPAGDPQRVKRIPLHPIAFDGAHGTGHDLRWSPWFGVGTADWRLLVVPGSLLLALLERIPELTCGVVEVTLRDPPARITTPGQADKPPQPQPLTIDDTLALIETAPHGLGAPAGDAAIAQLEREAPFALPPVYLALLRRHDGLELFGGEAGSALTIWGTRDRRAESAAATEFFNQPPPDGLFPFALDPQGALVWLLDRAGRVRGLGREGFLYGPDQPFEVWLGDMVRDLIWADAHPAFRFRSHFLDGRA